MRTSLATFALAFTAVVSSAQPAPAPPARRTHGDGRLLAGAAVVRSGGSDAEDLLHLGEAGVGGRASVRELHGRDDVVAAVDAAVG